MFDCFNLPHDLEALPHDEFDGFPIVLVSAAIQLTDYNVDTWFKKLKRTTFLKLTNFVRIVIDETHFYIGKLLV